METFNDLMRAVLAILPHATLGEDNEGQIIVYTNMKSVNSLTGEETDDIVDMDAE